MEGPLCNDPADEPEAHALCELAAHIHAATAEFSERVAAFDLRDAWGGAGIRSCAHWLSIYAGFESSTGQELIRVGTALAALPLTRAAFGAGELSLDKAKALAGVATAGDEEGWVELGRELTAGQLSRICRLYRQAREGNPEAQLANRGLWTSYREDGMLRLVALLPPEEGALVASVLESIALERSQQPAQAAGETLAEGREAPQVPDPAQDPWAARRADALVAVCEHAAGVAASELEGAPGRTRVVVHVYASLLSGKAEGGRCALEDGQALPPSVAERLACEAEVVELWEREGLPIDLGRSRRTVSPRLRMALNARDRGCCFPGCPIPLRRTHAHHLQHWAEGGRTDLSNLVSLCGFHHRRLHEGAYSIRHERDGSLSFEARNGKLIRAQSQWLDCASA
ncbi:MAG: DUF222 domain-containing protein, partial [Candidatus Dormibacteraeota bacterium]|nr:DUF222 domain-containing protein [Candidatus Dormibacteraeota bacterium]